MALAGIKEPMFKPYETLMATREMPLFIIGDHASKFIPRAYNNLGLRGHDLDRHIAWDLGTDIMIRLLCAQFGCAGHVATLSRLVIDMNREPEADGLIPGESDGTSIMANQTLTPADREARKTKYYVPYHAGLSRAIDQLPPTSLVISLHSFTPKPLTGHRRQTDIGLLAKHDMASAETFKTQLARLRPEFNIGINKPYSAYDLNYTIDTHIAPRRLRHLAIEVRQDHVNTKAKARRIAGVLAETITPLIARQSLPTLAP